MYLLLDQYTIHPLLSLIASMDDSYAICVVKSDMLVCYVKVPTASEVGLSEWPFRQ